MKEGQILTALLSIIPNTTKVWIIFDNLPKFQHLCKETKKKKPPKYLE